MIFDDINVEFDQKFEMSEDYDGSLEYMFKVVCFFNVEYFLIYFLCNFGVEISKVYFIGLKGDF